MDATEEAERRWPSNDLQVSERMRKSSFFAIAEGNKAMKREIFIAGAEWALSKQADEAARRQRAVDIANRHPGVGIGPL